MKWNIEFSCGSAELEVLMEIGSRLCSSSAQEIEIDLEGRYQSKLVCRYKAVS